MGKYRVEMIGCGRMRTHHVRAYGLNPKMEIVTVADLGQEKLELFFWHFNISACYRNYEDILKNEQIDIAAPVLLVIANPEVVIVCVQAVRRYSAIAASLEDVDRVVAECRAHGIPFAVGDAFRNFPQLWKACLMIELGELGQ